MYGWIGEECAASPLILVIPLEENGWSSRDLELYLVEGAGGRGRAILWVTLWREGRNPTK